MSNKKGIGASSGISIAKVFLLKEEELKIKKESSDSTKEITLLEKAIETTKKQIEEIKVIAAKNLGEETAAIFDAHLLVADDPAIKDEISNMIKNDNVSAPYATQQVSSNFIEMFSAMEDAYMKERAADVKDVCQRLIKNILGVKIPNLLTIKEEVIIAAKDLTPSETSQLNKKFVKGFITDIGGRTSHSAIMARTLEIPAIVGMGDVTSTVKDGQMIIMNGDTGEINLNPTAADIKKAEEGIKAIEKDNAELLKLIDKKATTTDGHSFKILANIGNPEEAELVKKYGGDGVGLFRSEFLYMDSADWPTEDVQFEAYKKALVITGKKVLIRTLDIGGDKLLNYFKFPEEMNPFLGYRAVRLCLDKKDIFKTQLRALLRAAKFGDLEVNVPMVATIEEVIETKKVIEECKKELTKEKIPFGDFKLGIMVEIPSTADIADIFAKHVDFFSIGTNDLIQYTFAADRMSEKVSYLYQPYHPAILRKIKKCIDASNDEKIFTAVCGEVAGDLYSTPLLVGAGLHEFSMSPTSMLKVKRLITQLNKKECEELFEKAVMLETNDQVLKSVKEFLKKKNIKI